VAVAEREGAEPVRKSDTALDASAAGSYRANQSHGTADSGTP